MGCSQSSAQIETTDPVIIDPSDSRIQHYVLNDGRALVNVKVLNMKYLHETKDTKLTNLINNCMGQANFSVVANYLKSKGLTQKELEVVGLDKLAIKSYTGNDLYAEVNHALNISELSTNQAEFVKLLCRALIRFGGAAAYKLPNKVYRRVNCEEESVLGYCLSYGKQICFRTFISTTKSEAVLKRWIGNLVFEIDLSEKGKGADITEMSQFVEEQEVLLIPNQVFTITGIVRDEDLPYAICKLKCVKDIE